MTDTLKKRDRNYTAEACPRCRAEKGQRCRNYKGQNKQPCRLPMQQAARSRKYYVFTWDPEKQDFTPQAGVKTGPYSLFGLRKALRELRKYGYACDRFDPAVLVESRMEGEKRENELFSGV